MILRRFCGFFRVFTGSSQGLHRVFTGSLATAWGVSGFKGPGYLAATRHALLISLLYTYGILFVTCLPQLSSHRMLTASVGSSDCFSSGGVGAEDIVVSILRMILAGFPATRWKGGTSFVTTLPAPTVAPLPILTPGKIIAPPPIQQSSPTWISLPVSGPRVPLRNCGSRGCDAE